MGELTVVVCSLSSVVLMGMVLIVAVVASWETPRTGEMARHRVALGRQRKTRT